MKDALMLLRPLQWFKNAFVFAPLFFSNNLLNKEYFIQTFWTFLAFCLVSSSIYCFNDIHDVESDRLHPKKKLRPIAVGKVSIWEGYFVMLLCLIGSLLLVSLSHSINMPILYALLLGYWGMNIAYCVRLKQFAILDVAIIAVGFVIRVPRKSIAGYNAQFIDLSVTIVGTITMVCYIIYTMNEGVMDRFGSSYVYLTNFWVLAGLLRYLQNMLVYQRSGSPTKVLVKDRFIQCCIIGWIASFFAIIYL